MAREGYVFNLKLVKEEPPDEKWIKSEVDVEEHELLQPPRPSNELLDTAESKHLFKKDISIKIEYDPETVTSQPAPERGVKVEQESVLGEVRIVKTEVDIQFSDSSPGSDGAPRPPEGAGDKVATIYECDICHHKYTRRYYLLRHIQNHLEPMKCDHCNYKTNVRSYMIKHVKTHSGNKPFKCYLCRYAAKKRDHLKSHLRTHTREKPFKCKICDFETSVRSNLNQHIKNHFKQPLKLKPNELRKTKNAEEKPHKCNVCEYKCSSLSALFEHIKYHTGEKPYQCKVCNQKFSHRSHLTTHIKSRTGEKPFECNLCEYKNCAVSYLNKHIETHKGDEHFKCDVCGCGFAIRSNLTNHKETHTKESFEGSQSSLLQPTFSTGVSSRPKLENPESAFKCNQCYFVTYTKTGLNLHTKMVHKVVKPVESNLFEYKTAFNNVTKPPLRTYSRKKS